MAYDGRAGGDLPDHAAGRRGAPRPVLRPLLPRGLRRRRRHRRSGSSRSREDLNDALRQALRRGAGGGPAELIGRPLEHRGEGGVRHALPHGDRGHAGPHRPALHHRLQRREGTLPGFVEGFRNVARDEHRHVAFGTWFLKETAGKDPAAGGAMREKRRRSCCRSRPGCSCRTATTRRRLGAVRLHLRPGERVCLPVAHAAAEGDRRPAAARRGAA